MMIAIKKNIDIGDWFNSPLHPVQSDLSQWMYSSGSCPVAEWVSERIINIPVDKKNLCRSMKFLLENIDMML